MICRSPSLPSDSVTFPIAGAGPANSRLPTPNSEPFPSGSAGTITASACLLEGNEGSEKGELIQAAAGIREVEKLGRADGPVNLARVYFKEGRLDDAVAALQRAAKFDPPAPRWTIAWLNGLVNKQNGYLDKAITEFRSILEDRYPELDKRGFDFSKDYEVINELGQTLLRARQNGAWRCRRAQQWNSFSRPRSNSERPSPSIRKT